MAKKRLRDGSKAAGADAIATAMLVFALQQVAVGNVFVAVAAGVISLGIFLLAEFWREFRLPEGLDEETLKQVSEQIGEQLDSKSGDGSDDGSRG